ncbi:hypothetical protein [Novosphingobium sp.]|uniref:hypothetical protein n=1 Tax=Novosphingobium sp. TaxID=1874826 RepID=UPI00286ABD53|nr:hypothetical protein [Novosphingobium sp.]
MDAPRSPTTPNWTVIAAATVVWVGLVLRALGYAPFDISHADEIMQYLEQAKRLATGSGIVPWEFRFGARNSLIGQVLSLPYWLGNALAPGTLVGMHAARITAIGLTLAVLPAAWKLGALTSRVHALAALGVVALWYESVLFSTLLLSEVIAAGPMLLAAALILAPQPSARALRWAGLLLGIGVALRLQYAPFAAVLCLARLRLDRQAWIWLVQGGLGALAICAVSDLVAGQVPLRWILVNFQYNMIEGRAARFGREGPFAYATMLLTHLGPLAAPILAAALLAPARYRPLVYALVATVLFHSLIAHKEYRFIWIAVQAALVLAAITSVSLLERSARARGMQVTGAGLALLGALWFMMSMAAEAHSGGARAMRGGAPIVRAALAGVAQGPACGIAIPDQWRAHLVSALLPRAVPIYVAPETVMSAIEPLPPGIAASANVLVFPYLPRGAAGFEERGCEENAVMRACTYVRKGTCQADPHWTYQAALERETL